VIFLRRLIEPRAWRDLRIRAAEDAANRFAFRRRFRVASSLAVPCSSAMETAATGIAVSLAKRAIVGSTRQTTDKNRAFIGRAVMHPSSKACDYLVAIPVSTRSWEPIKFCDCICSRGS
jgi:hypothetical protein